MIGSLIIGGCFLIAVLISLCEKRQKIKRPYPVARICGQDVVLSPENIIEIGKHLDDMQTMIDRLDVEKEWAIEELDAAKLRIEELERDEGKHP